MTHPALLSDDIIFATLSQLDVSDGVGAGAVCKAWRDQWRRRRRGLLCLLKEHVGRLKHTGHVAALPDGGAMVLEDCFSLHRPPHLAMYEIRTSMPPEAKRRQFQRREPSRFFSQGRLVTRTKYKWQGGEFHEYLKYSDGDPTCGFYRTYRTCSLPTREAVPIAFALHGDAAWMAVWGSREGQHDVPPILLQLRHRATEFRLTAETITSDVRLDLLGDHFGYMPRDMVVCDDALLVLCEEDWTLEGRGPGVVFVLDARTGAGRYQIGRLDYMEEHTGCGLHGPSSLAVEGDLCFIADTHNQRVVVLTWRNFTSPDRLDVVRTFGKSGSPPAQLDWDGNEYWDGSYLYDDERKGDGPGEFDQPYGVAVSGKMLYVSESVGRRIQVMRLPVDTRSSEPELLQIIPAPRGLNGWTTELMCGLSLEGDRLWCAGPESDGEDTHLHCFIRYV